MCERSLFNFFSANYDGWRRWKTTEKTKFYSTKWTRRNGNLRSHITKSIRKISLIKNAFFLLLSQLMKKSFSFIPIPLAFQRFTNFVFGRNRKCYLGHWSDVTQPNNLIRWRSTNSTLISLNWRCWTTNHNPWSTGLDAGTYAGIFGHIWTINRGCGRRLNNPDRFWIWLSYCPFGWTSGWRSKQRTWTWNHRFGQDRYRCLNRFFWGCFVNFIMSCNVVFFKGFVIGKVIETLRTFLT